MGNNVWTCSSCGTVNGSNATSCASCGTRRSVKMDPLIKEEPQDNNFWKCAVCGSQNPREAKFCSACGAKFGQQAGIKKASSPARSMSFLDIVILIAVGVNVAMLLINGLGNLRDTFAWLSMYDVPGLFGCFIYLLILIIGVPIAVRAIMDVIKVLPEYAFPKLVGLLIFSIAMVVLYILFGRVDWFGSTWIGCISFVVLAYSDGIFPMFVSAVVAVIAGRIRSKNI